MATSLAFLFFFALIVAGVFTMVKIHRAELAEARAKKLAATARIDAYRAKCFRPDGD